MEIIIPAAGLSTRFPNMRPKYSLVDFSGKTMIEKAVEPYINKYPITVGILKEHEESFNVGDLLKHQFKNKINIIILDKQTSGPADTVYQILTKSKIKKTSDIFIKDCDSFFQHKLLKGNYICISNFKNCEVIKKPQSKSYITTNEQGIITNIIEKQIISDKFCVGGYKFESADLFIKTYKELYSSKKDKEFFVSDIIKHCLLNKHIFVENVVTNYTDVGTFDDWVRYNDKSVIFCDIDGTIIQAQSRQSYSMPPVVLSNNVTILQKMVREGSEIIFTTARPNSAKKETTKMLKDIGFANFKLIMGLKNCKRILINDFNNANPYPRAMSINIPRNSDTINTFLAV